MVEDDKLTYIMPEDTFDNFYKTTTEEFPIIENLIKYHSKGIWRGDIMVLLCEYYALLDSLLSALDKAARIKEETEYYFSSLQAAKIMICLETVREYKQKLSEKNVSILIH